MSRSNSVELLFEGNESYLLGEESIRVEDAELRRYGGWRIAQDGSLHPQICRMCGRVVTRWPVDLSRFKMRRDNVSASWSYDGYFLVHVVTIEDLKEVDVHLPVREVWNDLAIIDVDQIPKCYVDKTASDVRMEDYCRMCGKMSCVLKGRTATTPPKPKPIVLTGELSPRELRVTDLHFGNTAHFQRPSIMIGFELAAELEKGVGSWFPKGS